MRSIRAEGALPRPASRALTLAALGAAAVAGACGQSKFPTFTGSSGKDASTPDLPAAEAAPGSGGVTAPGTGGGSSGGSGSPDGSGGVGPSGTGGRAPGTGGTSSGGTMGGSGGAATGGAGTAGTGAGGMGAGEAFVTVTAVVMGGPAGTRITPSSPTPGSSCAAGSCKIPVGGSVMVVAPSLTDWFFDSWTGGEHDTAAATYQMDDLAHDVTLTAHYINQRSERCRLSPPDNAETTDNPLVTTTYTTAGGWSIPETCPWKCLTGFCQTQTSCLDLNIDAIAWTGEIGGYGWYGGDDRPDFGPRSVGVGQSLTPSTQVTMTRFGFDFDPRVGFVYDSSGKAPSEPILLELDRRDANGTVLATYSVKVPPDFHGGWLFWDTPATVLAPGVTIIFTSYLPNAFTQPVDSGVVWAEADYPGGVGYSAIVTSGDLRAWSPWYVDGNKDNLFRLQQHNPACK